MAVFKPVEYRQVVDKEYQNKIYDYLTDISFPWHFMEDATTEKINTIQGSTPAFGNLLFYPGQENPHLEFFKPLIAAIERESNMTITNLMRVRAGFLLNTKYAIPSMPYKYNTPHRDYDQEHYVAVYYVNETDGDTVIFHETERAEKYYPMHKCSPEPGKVLLFNGWHYHSSTCPKMFTKRIAININFTAIKND